MKIKFLPFGRLIQYGSKPFYRFSVSFLVEKILPFISNKIIVHSAILDMHIHRRICVTSQPLFCIVSNSQAI